MERLHYHNSIGTAAKKNEIINLITVSGEWLDVNLGQSTKPVTFDSTPSDDHIDEDGDPIIDNSEFLFAKIAELIGNIGSVQHVTWAIGPGYEMLICISYKKDAYSTSWYHDLVIEFEDPLQALQFKLAVA
jgi:hypothetical protein